MLTGVSKKADRQGKCHKLYDLKLVDDFGFSSFQFYTPNSSLMMNIFDAAIKGLAQNYHRSLSSWHRASQSTQDHSLTSMVCVAGLLFKHFEKNTLYSYFGLLQVFQPHFDIFPSLANPRALANILLAAPTCSSRILSL